MDPTGKVGERGEFEGVWDAEETMPHIGQPAFGVNAIVLEERERERSRSRDELRSCSEGFDVRPQEDRDAKYQRGNLHLITGILYL